jgi:hypothetical protein
MYENGGHIRFIFLTIFSSFDMRLISFFKIYRWRISCMAYCICYGVGVGATCFLSAYDVNIPSLKVTFAYTH